MEQKAKLWIDLSDMILWRGHFTGIQRVVYNIAKRFDINYEQANFFHYDAGRNMFLEIKFVDLDKKLNSDNNTQAADAIIDNVPGRVYKLAIRAKNKAQRIYTSTQDSDNDLPIAVFGGNDSVIVLGGNWDKPGYMRLMSDLKSTKKFKFYQMYYDLIPIFDQGHVADVEHNRFQKYIKDTLYISDGAFVISEHTKKDLRRFIKQHKLKDLPITVVRLGDDIVPRAATGKPNDKLVGIDYILVVGTVEVRKNHALIYYAMKLLAENNVALPIIVIAGKDGWLTGDIKYQFIHDASLKDKVVFLPKTSDEELGWLYANCKFTIYPSFYEGWGLPVAESLLYGKFCIASNSSSIPEIAGELIDYFSPHNSQELAVLIEKYMKEPKLLMQREVAINQKYKSYSWDDSYNTIKDVVSS